MTRIPVIAIFDIGKTNKKLLFFDEDYHVVYEKQIHLVETKDEDGDACEDIHVLTKWIRDSFKEAEALEQFDVRAINYSTYGASFVNLGKDGQPAGPLYNYLKPFPEDLQQQFYSRYGGENQLSQMTASPVLGHLNSGLLLYRLRHQKTSLFESIDFSLHLPQYVSWLFTGRPASELTSIGCHTHLWDFKGMDYHPWVEAEGILPKLPTILPSSTVFEIKSENKLLYSGIGLHDSSSALIPYLASVQEPFVLLSTGTWSISLNPFNDAPLTQEHLAHDCLCYLSYEGRPVKASRLFSGHIHDEQVTSLSRYFSKPEDYYLEVSRRADWKLFRSREKRTFSDLKLDAFRTFEEAYVCFLEELVKRQVEATNRVMSPTIKSIFVDGGFSLNPIFMQLLSEVYGDKKVYAAAVGQATALGAAMAIHESWNKKKVGKVIDLILYPS